MEEERRINFEEREEDEEHERNPNFGEKE